MAVPGALGTKAAQSAEQIFVWQVAAQIVGALMTPLVQELTRAVNSVSQTTPLSPADLAQMVVRAVMSHPDAEAYAKQSGIAPGDFTRLLALAGEPPSPQELIQALRRQIIEHDGTGPDSTSFQQGIAEGRLYNKWLPVVEALGDVPIGPADAVDAFVKGQLPETDAAHEAFLSGISAARFQVLVNTRGNPPSPGELAELLKRGLIPLEGTGPDALSFQQGIFEGATKNKWWQLFSKLADYIPPPRTVTAMVREGSLTDAQALQLFKDAGLPQDLAAAYLVSAHHQKTQTERDLTVATVKSLYQDGLVSQAEATQMLEALRYSAQDTAFLVDIWDFEVFQQKVRTAIAKVHSLYVAYKLDNTQVSQALDQLGVPARGKDQYLTIWGLERTANVPQLTRAEIVDAWYYSILSDVDADKLLEQLGWSPEDATILRGIRARGRARPSVPPP